MKSQADLDEILRIAVREAIEKCGYSTLRSMEFFGTNERRTQVAMAA